MFRDKFNDTARKDCKTAQQGGHKPLDAVRNTYKQETLQNFRSSTNLSQDIEKIPNELPTHSATILEQRANIIDQIREMSIDEQRKKIIEHTRKLPINEQRPIWEQWINAISECDMAQEKLIMNLSLLDRARTNILDQAKELPISEKRTICEQRADMINQVRKLPINKQRPIWEQWINTIPESYKAQETHEMNNILPEVDQQIQSPITPKKIQGIEKNSNDKTRFRGNKHTNADARAEKTDHPGEPGPEGPSLPVNRPAGTRPQGNQRVKDVLANSQLPEVNQRIQPISQPTVEHRPTEQHIEGGSTSNRGDSSSRSAPDTIKPANESHHEIQRGKSSAAPDMAHTTREVSKILQETLTVNKCFLGKERRDIRDHTRNMPINQQREHWRNWINTLPENIRPQEIQKMNNILARRQRQKQLPKGGQHIQPTPQPSVEHRPTEQHIKGGSTSNRRDISSISNRTNSPERGSSHPTSDANTDRSTQSQRAQRMRNLLRISSSMLNNVAAPQESSQTSDRLLSILQLGNGFLMSDILFADTIPQGNNDTRQRQNQLPEVDQQEEIIRKRIDKYQKEYNLYASYLADEQDDIRKWEECFEESKRVLDDYNNLKGNNDKYKEELQKIDDNVKPLLQHVEQLEKTLLRIKAAGGNTEQLELAIKCSRFEMWKASVTPEDKVYAQKEKFLSAQNSIQDRFLGMGKHGSKQVQPLIDKLLKSVQQVQESLGQRYSLESQKNVKKLVNDIKQLRTTCDQSLTELKDKLTKSYAFEDDLKSLLPSDYYIYYSGAEVVGVGEASSGKPDTCCITTAREALHNFGVNIEKDATEDKVAQILNFPRHRRGLSGN